MALSRSLCLLIALSVALSACGRRGPLEAPLATAPEPAQAANTNPASQSNSVNNGLARTTQSAEEIERDRAQLLVTPGARTPKTPFILDPLL